MSAELIARYGPIVVGAVLLAPLVVFLSPMLFEMRLGKRWRTRVR
jgi:hypothetical protein